MVQHVHHLIILQAMLAAMGLDGSRIEASLRLSWGPNSDLKEVVDNFKKLLYVAKLMAN